MHSTEDAKIAERLLLKRMGEAIAYAVGRYCSDPDHLWHIEAAKAARRVMRLDATARRKKHERSLAYLATKL